MRGAMRIHIRADLQVTTECEVCELRTRVKDSWEVGKEKKEKY